MAVHFTPEEESRLSQIAMCAGRTVSLVVHDAVAQALYDEARFVAAVEKGIAAADRGELLDHDAVVQRIVNRFGR